MIAELSNSPGSLFAVFNAACAAVATGAAVYVAVRDSRWRKTGLAKQLSDKIDAAQRSADDWDKSPSAMKLRGDVERHGLKLGEHEDALKHVATKADVVQLRGEINVAVAGIKTASQGIDRIEGFLIKQALSDRARS